MSSPVAKRRNIGRIVDSEDDYESAGDVSIDKENVVSPGKETASLSPKRVSLVQLDQNVRLNPVILEHPDKEVVVPASPTRTKPSFTDMIQLSPTKSSKIINHQERQEPVTRLVIDKLVLHNFKSYAGEQVIGPFHTSFSAVVGPNGSGKSNVIDSMLFVFGFRANKMRQGKLSELIHNSEAAPNLQSCSVDIHFLHVTDNLDDTTTIVPESELIISRKAFKNNSSDYFINGKKSNYSQVTTLLKDKGIDLDHKRFLILQGEVESIAQMKPKAEKESDDGLLEYLEDIIGTSSYKSSIEDSYKKIDELNEICQEKENRFNLVEKEKTSLESKKDEALEFLLNEKNLIEQKSNLYQYKINKSKINIEKSNLILKDLELKLENEKSQTLEFTNQIKLIETEYSNLLKSSQENSNEIKKIQDFQKKSDREKVSIEEKKKNLDNKKKKSEKLLNIAINALNESESKLKNINEENDNHLIELEDLKNSLTKEKLILDEIRLELTDKTKDFTNEIEIYEKKLQPWNELIEKKKSDITIAESKVEMLKEKSIQFDKDVSDLKNRTSQINNEINSFNLKINELNEEFDHNNEQIQLGTKECDYASVKLEEMGSVLSTHRQKTLESRNSLSTVQNKNKVLSGLMRLQDTGRIQGFYGRLGDLGYIDDKYDVAISTACGQLDDMVVETVEVGQQCIEYLRKNNLGYARFILLTKLRNFNLNKISTPKNAPRLFDLVKPKDPKFSNAFYSVLQDTLVASNLTEANQVAYGSKRFRVVTLDGKLIDKSGTLSGGGHVVNKGGMKSSSQVGSVSEKEVLQLEKELNDKEANFETAQNTFYEMKNALTELKDRQPEIKTLISQHNLEIESLNNESKNIKVRLNELIRTKDSIVSNDEEVLKSESNVEALKNDHLKLLEESKEIQNKINELQEKIMQVGGVKLRLQDSKVDSIKQKIEIISNKLNNNKVSNKKLENELKRFYKSKIEKESEIENIITELNKIEENFSEKIKLLETFDADLKKLNDLKYEFESKSETLKEQLDEKQETVNGLRSAEIEIENDIKIHKSSIDKDTKLLNNFTESLNSLESNDYSELLSFLNDDEEINKYTNPVLSELSTDEIDALNIKEIEEKVEKLQDFISKSKVNTDILEEFGKRAKEYNSRKLDLNEAVKERDDIKKMSEDLKKKRLDEFMEGFNTISGTLKEMYQMITMGGNAELELVDSLDPFSEGILFSVMPPRKSWKNISNLSGGEKTLSSLALVFALHTYKPTPLYVMDEIDAALDFRNVSIVANYIKERTKNAQFVVISLRNNMFELAQQLVGIYKVNNMTRSITLQNRDMLGNE